MYQVCPEIVLAKEISRGKDANINSPTPGISESKIK